MDLSNSVIMPREDFMELQAVSFNQLPTPFGQRIASTIHTTVYCVVVVIAFTAASWGWAKAMEWRDERNHQRLMEKYQKFGGNSQ